MYTGVLSSVFALAAVAVAKQPSVTIKNGTVRGIFLPQFGQDLFLGIPFAQPPVGNLRLALPQSINTSFGTLDATAYGPHCFSSFTTGFVCDDNSGYVSAEDCLTLNVIRPHGIPERAPVPVLVWIFFAYINEGDFRYNGTWMVKASVDNGKPIIFVSINYRLASLGFLGGKVIQDGGLLNLGFRDQRLALHWVQENIEKFGGDPRKVTIQGESSGGTSVHAHVVAYRGRDDKLFNQVIAQSAYDTGVQFIRGDAASFQANFNSLIVNTTCASTANASAIVQLSCIRSLPIDAFRRASAGTTGFTFDGDFLSTPSFLNSYRTGRYVKASFIVGSNMDEGRTFSPSGVNTTAQAIAALTGIPAQFRDVAVALYPDVPALGCPFNTGDFQTFLGVTLGAQNKRLAAISGDVIMAASVFHGETQVSY
ncbi:Alpha/Beta hydrolase protein [Mycena rebaudengoi]|nr:Alpha/Beta hydrolase protein [Mycena rebaudengoi]